MPLWSCRLRWYAMVTPNSVTPHCYATVMPRGYAGYATITPNSVATHGYATYRYASYAIGYAKHGYATWLRHVRLRQLRHRLWQTRLRHIVTPLVVTPWLRQTRLRHMWSRRLRHDYAIFGYVTWLRHIRLCQLRHWLRQTRLCNMVMPRTVMSVMPNSVTPRGYATCGYASTPW